MSICVRMYVCNVFMYVYMYQSWVSRYLTEQHGWSSDTSDLHSLRCPVRISSGYRLFWVFMIFRNPSRRMSGQWLETGPGHFVLHFTLLVSRTAISSLTVNKICSWYTVAKQFQNTERASDLYAWMYSACCSAFWTEEPLRFASEVWHHRKEGKRNRDMKGMGQGKKERGQKGMDRARKEGK